MAQAYPTFSGRLVGVADLRVSGVSHRRTKAAVCRAGILEQIIKPITNSGKVRARVVMRQPVRALLARPRCLSTPRRTQKLELKEGIANFYDESSQLWESMWGAPPRGAPPRPGQEGAGRQAPRVRQPLPLPHPAPNGVPTHQACLVPKPSG